MTDSLGKHYDAIVVGSGPAGATAVKELTERGLEVLLLEAGREITEDDFVPGPPTPPAAMSIDLGGRARAFMRGQFVQARRAMYQPQKDPFLVNDFQQPYSTKDGDFLWIRGQQLGGRFHSYGRMLLRGSDHEFKGRSLTGRGEDWPISYADLEPYYDSIEEFLGLYGNSDDIENLPNGVYRGPSLLTEAEKRFQQIVAERWPERKVVGWRYAAPNLHRVPLGVVAARETGRLTERMNAVVNRVTIDSRTGLADGVVFIDRHTKQEHRATADTVVLCASTIESIRLLLNSAGSGHPDGLGNSSGLLGKYFMDQTPSLLFGDDPNHPGFERIDPAPADPYYPPVGGVYIPQFDNLDTITNPSIQHGWAMQGTVGRIPVPEGHGGTVGLMGFGEIEPIRDNNVTISRRRKDHWGIPVPRIRLAVGENERNLMRAQVSGLKEMALASGYRINFAGSPLGLDSKKVWPNADPISRAMFILAFKKSVSMGAAIHECGGARMGSDPSTSVVNSHNQSWDVPNLFVTDASTYVTNGAVGPTLTIMAMTARACEFIAEQHRSGDLHKKGASHV
ncbi:GMC oxidoreductase [Brachybacterium kimchii]|uniref:GMC family oxidoreductase n=1 Tax=Brachybacterium kimchii TaxID=2942909 RepID=A0ABY4N7A2_9MICO|nr:GMC family oxidoreductase [Brachybacterium kimchii]UQN30441.1 GMC family oxidoreductase [Brachybacterium kimchii]